MPALLFQIQALAKHHDRSRFQCGNEVLNNYLQLHARQDADRRIAAPYVAVRSPSEQVLGYYTLSASVLLLGELPPEAVRKLPRYPQLPVTLLGRLAVDRDTKGQKLGELLLMDALHRSLTNAAQIGAMAVIVDAKDESAVAFYLHFGFIPVQTTPMRLFLPMKTVAQILG